MGRPWVSPSLLPQASPTPRPQEGPLPSRLVVGWGLTGMEMVCVCLCMGVEGGQGWREGQELEGFPPSPIRAGTLRRGLEGACDGPQMCLSL